LKVVIFGAAELASLAWFALTTDSQHHVVGFAVDRPYLRERQKHGLPVIPFDELESQFSPDGTAIVAPLGLEITGGLAVKRRTLAREAGYASLSYVSSRAIASPDLRFGENCFIFDGVVAEPFVNIGDDVVIRGGCHLSHNVAISNGCFLAPRVTLGGGVRIGERCFIGIGAIVQSQVRVASGCIVTAGARLTRDTAADGVYDGAPAIRRAISPHRFKRVLARSVSNSSS
jgi:sugar O-acyltransferase (sialic acid O-acetyltransferase NeuD family)